MLTLLGTSGDRKILAYLVPYLYYDINRSIIIYMYYEYVHSLHSCIGIVTSHLFRQVLIATILD